MILDRKANKHTYLLANYYIHTFLEIRLRSPWLCTCEYIFMGCHQNVQTGLMDSNEINTFCTSTNIYIYIYIYILV